MKLSPGSVALGSVGLIVGVVGVISLRDATLSTHEEVPPGSRLEVRFEAADRNPEANQTVSEMVEALVLACRLEVVSDVAGEVEALGGDRYRAMLTPSLDETNRRQFRGCMEDWTLDGLQVDELTMTDAGIGGPRP